MANLTPARINKLLSGQDKRIQSVAILHLPQEKMEEVVSEMSFDQKKNVVLEAFLNPRINPKDLELADETLRFMVKQEDKLEEGVIEIPSLVPQMLMCMNVIEEIKLVQQILSKLSDKGEYLKTNFPSLAFLPEWPEEKIRSFLSNVPPQDILCLVKMIPEATEKILVDLPNRTQTILRDSMKKEMTEDDLQRGLENLKLRMYKAINDGQLVLTQLFPRGSGSQAKAA